MRLVKSNEGHGESHIIFKTRGNCPSSSGALLSGEGGARDLKAGFDLH